MEPIILFRTVEIIRSEYIIRVTASSRATKLKLIWNNNGQSYKWICRQLPSVDLHWFKYTNLEIYPMSRYKNVTNIFGMKREIDVLRVNEYMTLQTCGYCHDFFHLRIPWWANLKKKQRFRICQHAKCQRPQKNQIGKVDKIIVERKRRSLQKENPQRLNIINQNDIQNQTCEFVDSEWKSETNLESWSNYGMNPP